MLEPLDMPPLFLKGRSGGTIAYRNRPCKPEQSGPGILFCGGYRSSMNGNKALALDQYSKAKNCQFTRFDYEGHGASHGLFEDGTIGLWFENTLDILDQLTSSPQIVIGSSMGGWMAMLLARARPELVAALVLIAPAPDFPTRLILPKLSASDRQNIIDKGLMTEPSAFSDEDYPYTWKMIKESRHHNLLDGEKNPYAGPVHIFIGDRDDVIPIEHAQAAADSFVLDNVTFEIVAGGDHRLSSPQDLLRLTQLLDELLKL